MVPSGTIQRGRVFGCRHTWLEGGGWAWVSQGAGASHAGGMCVCVSPKRSSCSCWGVGAGSGPLHPNPLQDVKTPSTPLLSPSGQRDLAVCPSDLEELGLPLKLGAHAVDQEMLSDSLGGLQAPTRELERRGHLQNSWLSLKCRNIMHVCVYIGWEVLDPTASLRGKALLSMSSLLRDNLKNTFFTEIEK